MLSLHVLFMFWLCLDQSVINTWYSKQHNCNLFRLFLLQYVLLVDIGPPWGRCDRQTWCTVILVDLQSKWEPAFFLPSMSLHPMLDNVPFAPLVDVNRKKSGGDFLKEVCFCNHQSSCWNVEAYPGCHSITIRNECLIFPVLGSQICTFTKVFLRVYLDFLMSKLWFCRLSKCVHTFECFVLVY